MDEDFRHVLPEALRDIDAAQTVLLLDIDGTLSPTVPDPDAASVSEELLALVARAVERCMLVGIITGRAPQRARELVPVAGTWLAATHGMNVINPDGDADVCPIASGAARQVQMAATLAQTVGWHYEDKGQSVTVHLRQRGALGQSLDAGHVRSQLRMVLDPRAVELRDAKHAIEVRPAGARTKGDAVAQLAAAAPGAGAIVFIGDDLTDLDAFTALDAIGGEGRRTVKVAVGGADVPPELVAAADVVLADQRAVGPLLANFIGERDA